MQQMEENILIFKKFGIILYFMVTMLETNLSHKVYSIFLFRTLHSHSATKSNGKVGTSCYFFIPEKTWNQKSKGPSFCKIIIKKVKWCVAGGCSNTAWLTFSALLLIYLWIIFLTKFSLTIKNGLQLPFLWLHM